MTTLIKITLTKYMHGNEERWTVVRERENNGETASGMTSLEDAFDYIRAHDAPEVDSGEEGK